MKKYLLSAVFLGVIGLFTTTPAMATWIDWTSTSAGTLDINGSTVNVSLTGTPYNLINGDYYYNNASTGFTSPAGTYAGLEPSDVIQINAGGAFTLNFSEAIIDPYIALVSVGQPRYGVTYSFNDPFSVISSGSNIWGGPNSYSINGNDFTGYEFNGVLQMTGSFTSISFTIAPNEFWHGFNFGTSGATTSVPEPASLALLGLGLAGLGFSRRKKV